MEFRADLNRFEWTDENIEIARMGMVAGHSAAQIGRVLGCTRNAVIGKMGRMGIKSQNIKGFQTGQPGGPKPLPKPAPRPNMMTINARAARARVGKSEPPRIPVAEPQDAPIIPPRTSGKSLLELAPHDCRWPYGDVGEETFFFCGHEAIEDRPYCLGHCSIAYRPTPRLLRRRDDYEVAAA